MDQQHGAGFGGGQPRQFLRGPPVRTAGQRFDGILGGVFLQVVQQQREQDQGGNGAAIGPPRLLARRGRKQHHVQHDVVISAIAGVSVCRPVPRMQMHFDVTRQDPVAHPKPGIAEIRTAEQIPPPGLHHPQRPAVLRGRPGRIELAPQPDLLQQALRENKRAVEPLDLRHPPILARLFN